MNFNSGPTVTFTPTPASFPFENKQLSLSLSKQIRVPLESQSNEAPSSSNGIFPKDPLSLSTPHAEIWVQGKQLLIRDRSSTYGTFVNGIRIQHQTLLESGDVVTLGQPIPPSSAPPNTSDPELKPIEACIFIVGL